MKKSNAVIAIIIVIVLVVGGYLIFHKSPKSTTTTSKSSTSSNTPAVNNAVVITRTDASLGQYLADPSGAALYTYGADTSGVSNCTGSCLADWPAYLDTGSTNNLPAGISTFKRSDNGQTQYAYNGMPLYTFISDTKGHVTGNGVSNFKVAKPVATSSSSSSTTPSSSSTGSSSSSSSSSGYPY